MYPSRELNDLALRKAFLRMRISLGRRQCAGIGRSIGSGVRKWMAWGRLLRAGGLLGAVGVGLFGGGRRRGIPAAGPGGEASSTFARRALQWAPAALKAVRLVAGW
jgi:hypothetical protein